MDTHTHLSQTELDGAIRRPTAAASRGMTLIEIMIVVAIISLIMGGVGLVAFQRFQAAQLDTARNNALQQQQLVEQYMIQKRGKCPKSWQDPVKANIGTKVLKHPWGNEFILKCEGGKVEVSSAGPDGEPGTEDDISATDDTPSQQDAEGEEE